MICTRVCNLGWLGFRDTVLGLGSIQELESRVKVGVWRKWFSV